MNITVNGVSITLTPEQLIQLDAEVKKQQAPPKSTAEEWLLKFLSQSFTTKFTKGLITHYIGDQWIFQQDLKNSTLWCYYYKIWQVFEKEYSANYNEIQTLIKNLVLEPLNCKGFTPKFNFDLTAPLVLEPLNCKGFTPAREEGLMKLGISQEQLGEQKS